MANYLEIIGTNYPEAGAIVRNGADPTVYSNIEWITTPIPQATLDATEYATIGVPSGNISQFTFGDVHGKPLDTKSDNFTRVRTVQFDGTEILGTPIQLRFTTWMEEGDVDNTGEIRVFDVTHNNFICTVTVSNPEEDIISTSDTTNWPTELSLLEIQIRVATGSKKNHMNLSGMAIVF